MFAELEEVIAIIITFWEIKYALHLTTTKKKKKIKSKTLEHTKNEYFFLEQKTNSTAYHKLFLLC